MIIVFDNILSIETSCDETAVAVLSEDGCRKSELVASQEYIHGKYGGIVPEVASRRHVEVLNFMIEESLEMANTGYGGLDAVVVTAGPGLIGSLLIGLTAAKTISYCFGLPLVGVDHVISHIFANFYQDCWSIRPAVCLVVSGGHTSLFLIDANENIRCIGRTIDDAAGEAMDKIARYFGLGYPGGPLIDKLSCKGSPKAIDLPRPMLRSADFNFSFSGLKTAVVRTVTKNPHLIKEPALYDILASFQEAIVDTLVLKTIEAVRFYSACQVMIAGGVAANSRLRERMFQECLREGVSISSPPIKYCTDNAVMTGLYGIFKINRRLIDDMNLDAYSLFKNH
jgi:N6-L-threonylcarbamoyladenine synthase